MAPVCLGGGGLNENCVVWVISQLKPGDVLASQTPKETLNSKGSLTRRSVRSVREMRGLKVNAGRPFCQQKGVRVPADLCTLVTLRSFYTAKLNISRTSFKLKFILNPLNHRHILAHFRAMFANYSRQALVKIGLCQLHSFTFGKETSWETTTWTLNIRNLCELSMFSLEEVIPNRSLQCR